MAKKQSNPKKADAANAPISSHTKKKGIVKKKHSFQSVSLQNLKNEAVGGSGCPDNKFAYAFETENASVLFLKVEDFEVNNPDESDDFTTCINDASPAPKIRVVGLAKVNNPGGRVALTLKFLGKDVFSSPKEFTLTDNGFLKLDTLVKLPL